MESFLSVCSVVAILLMISLPVLLNYYIAGKKNRSRLGWAVAGIFTSFASTILLASWSPKGKRKEFVSPMSIVILSVLLAAVAMMATINERRIGVRESVRMDDGSYVRTYSEAVTHEYDMAYAGCFLVVLLGQTLIYFFSRSQEKEQNNIDDVVQERPAEQFKVTPVFKITLIVIIGIFAAGFLLSKFVVRFSKVIYPSGRIERGVIYKLDYKFRKPAIGDQVIFIVPQERERSLAGFVTGFPQEGLMVDGQKVMGTDLVAVQRGEKEYVVPLKDIEGRFRPFSSVERPENKPMRTR